MMTVIIIIISFLVGFITNNLVSILKLKEKINGLKLQAYKDLLRSWIIARNVIIGYMLVRGTDEGFKKQMKVRLKLEEAYVSSSALISEICLYCEDKSLINCLLKVNDALFLEKNWLEMSEDQINRELEKLKTQVFKLFSNLREEIEMSSMFTCTDIKKLFIKNKKQPSF